MGTNIRGQLGVGSQTKGSTIPLLLEELTFIKFVKIRAG